MKKFQVSCVIDGKTIILNVNANGKGKAIETAKKTIRARYKNIDVDALEFKVKEENLFLNEGFI